MSKFTFLKQGQTIGFIDVEKDKIAAKNGDVRSKPEGYDESYETYLLRIANSFGNLQLLFQQETGIRQE